MHLVGPRRVEDDLLTPAQQPLGAAQQFLVRRVDARSAVAVPCTCLTSNLVGPEHHGADLLAERRRCGRLACARQPADEHEPDPAVPEMTQAELLQCVDLGRGFVALRRTDGSDLRTDVRPIGEVVVCERGGPHLARELPVGGKELRCGGRVAEVLQVHREEADVEEHVAPPQLVVELQAVEDPRTI